MRKILLLLILPIFLFKSNINKSHADVGLSLGADIEIADEIIIGNDENSLIKLPIIKDSIFIGGEGFANYYDNNDKLNYSYGLKGKLGYSISIVDLYGFYGYQDVNLDNNQMDYFSKTKTPIYGYGIAYGLGIMKIKFETSYFELEDKSTNSDKRFVNSGLSVFVGF